MTLLYFDCVSGAAGDMLLGALIDAGAPEEAVRSQLEGLGIQGWEMHVSPVNKGGLRAMQVTVSVHDDVTSRTHTAIRELLQRADLAPGVRARSLRTFEILAGAEAKIHDSHPDYVHFHEVGGIDALIDIVGCSAALEHIGPTRIVTSPLVTGRGWTDSSHGRIPVPAPATLEILRGAPISEMGDRELITPTGAALLAAASDSFGPLPPMRLDAIGYGAGTSDLDHPNVTRVLLGEALGQAPPSGPWLIESNIDDMSPELVPHTIEALLRAGASDAWTTPIVMKKGRPAITLSILVTDEAKERALDVLYRETTTFGARMQRIDKSTIEREWIEVTVENHPVRVKMGRRGGEVVTISPEFEDAARAARATGLALREVFDRAASAARTLLESRS